jgi:predicted negative regulator of RcsB-dependent stress response
MKYLTGKNVVIAGIVIVLALLAWSLYSSRKKKTSTGATLTPLQSAAEALGVLSYMPGVSLPVGPAAS